MRPTHFPFHFTKVIAALVGTAFGLSLVQADVVYITARPQPSGSGANPDGTYADHDLGDDTSAKSSVSDAPPRSGGRYFGTAFMTSTADYGITLTPTLGAAPGIYRIDHTFNSGAGNCNTNAVLGAVATDGTLSFESTDKFQAPNGNSTWVTLGYITNTTTTPAITLYYLSGTVDIGAELRLIIDTFKFTRYEPCLEVAPVGVTGPLGANLSSVTVTGVATNATKITVYQNSGSGMVKIGEKTTGMTNGINMVTVNGLVKSAQVAATQTIGAQESCVPERGMMVGGGANPRVRLALSIREAPDATGPAGTNGVGQWIGNIHFLGATNNLINPYTPADGRVIYPSNDWQTVTWFRGEDPYNPVDGSVQWYPDTAKNTQNGLTMQWGVFESIAVVIDDLTDTGPFDFYLDNISNGTNGIIQDFEGADAGQTGYAFNAPSFSGTTSGYLLELPNDAVISTNAADASIKSLRVRFQFSTTNAVNWLRLNTYNSSASAPPGWNPLVDLSQPISIRLLLRPVSTAPPELTFNIVNGNIVLSWEGTYRLQESTSVNGTYSNVAEPASSPYTVSPTGAGKFYRLTN